MDPRGPHTQLAGLPSLRIRANFGLGCSDTHPSGSESNQHTPATAASCWLAPYLTGFGTLSVSHREREREREDATSARHMVVPIAICWWTLLLGHQFG